MAINRIGPGQYIDTATGRKIQGAANPAAAAQRFQNMTAKGTNIAADNRPTPAPTPGGNGGSSPQPQSSPQPSQNPIIYPTNMQNGMSAGGGQASQNGMANYQNIPGNIQSGYQQNPYGGYQQQNMGGYQAQPNIMQTQNPQMTAANIAQNMYGSQNQGLSLTPNTNRYL